MASIEIEEKGNYILEISGNVIAEDESFDHAFGTEHRTGYRVEDFQVTLWLGDVDYDMTDLISQDDDSYYIQKLIEEYLEENPC